MRTVHGTLVSGVDVEPDTRCAHYRTDRDVVALKFGCCESYFPCFRCHDAVTDHPPVPWPRDRFDEPAVLCGACGLELTPSTYLSLGERGRYACPGCDAAFNPGCRAHAHLYFDVEDERAFDS
ncbi:CHY zinc finger protein [Natrononativus amylolyticus]|uniref:CHY zinc finger protein n=1 Tax=Natrononativus amylolyticus TaxID=2963434 RepID=UPI0020CC2196|nr:CHY zinc finger protein [Natrononativus amylolyticus]